MTTSNSRRVIPGLRGIGFIPPSLIERIGKRVIGSYNYNTSYIGHGQFESIPAPVKATSVRRPSATAIFGDGQWAGRADKFMRAPFPNPGDAAFSGRWAGTQGFRHRGRTNVAFCDGHAEALSDVFTNNADGSANVAPGTGFLSSDNRLYDGE